MSFTTVVDKTVGDAFTEAMWDTYIKDNLNTGVTRPIAETTLGSGAASIDFTSIAASWSHLLLVFVGRIDTPATHAEVLLRFNNDSGGSYDHQRIDAAGATVTAAEALAVAQLAGFRLPGDTAPTDVYGMFSCLIAHYAAADKQKSAEVTAGAKGGTTTGTLETRKVSGWWRSTAAINRITVLPAAGTFKAGSRATLYGMGGI